MDSISNAFRSFWNSPWSLVGVLACMGFGVFFFRDEQGSGSMDAPPPPPARSGGQGAFASKPQQAPRTTTPEAVAKEPLLVRQLDRHVRMRTVGYYDSILGNPNLPEALKSRVRAEYDRLESLARQNRDIVSFIEVNAFPAAIDSEGKVDPKLALSIDSMRRDGSLEGLQKSYLNELKRRAVDPELPEQDRPTEEEIEAARKGGAFPVAF